MKKILVLILFFSSVYSMDEKKFLIKQDSLNEQSKKIKEIRKLQKGIYYKCYNTVRFLGVSSSGVILGLVGNYFSKKTIGGNNNAINSFISLGAGYFGILASDAIFFKSHFEKYKENHIKHHRLLKDFDSGLNEIKLIKRKKINRKIL